MPLESASKISELVATNPGINDDASRGDDHLRLIKQVLLDDLGSLDGPLTVTASHINNLESTLQSYADTAVSDAVFGSGNTGTVGADGVVGDYEAADANLQSQIDTNASDISSLDSTLATFMNDYLKNVYPVGSIYINASNSNNPNAILGFGSWQAYGQGRVIMGAGQTSDGTQTKTFVGGDSSGTFEHTLSVSEMPSHRHRTPTQDGFSTGVGVFQQMGGDDVVSRYTDFEGGGQPHNNMQPYIVAYIWKRIG